MLVRVKREEGRKNAHYVLRRLEREGGRKINIM
jgi:hypothetical protein